MNCVVFISIKGNRLITLLFISMNSNCTVVVIPVFPQTESKADLEKNRRGIRKS